MMVFLIMFLLSIPSQTLAVNVALSSETDKIALLALKDKLTNGDPHALPSWNESLHFCEWQGVTCSRRHMRVSSLQLQNQYWGGTFAPSLGNLTFLKEINFTNINLHGEILGEVGRLKRLKILDLRNNNLGGHIPVEMINCSSLEVIILMYNNLTGKVPSWFGSMVQLTQLGLAANGNLSSNLVWLAMGSNQISGRIPEGIGKLVNLASLDMELNFLQGTIPDSIGKLKNLGVLWLDGNKFYGNIPLVIGNLTMLFDVDLSSNKFEGLIPFTLGYCTNMQKFAAWGNNISGNIPNQTFGYQQGLIELFLYSNSFTGPIPSDFGNLNHLSILDLQDNKLIGEIPMRLSACTALTVLVLEGNSFHGSIPSFLGSLLSLEVLDLSNNNFSSSIPHQLVNLTLLKTLNLSFNHLSGEVPVGGVFNNITAISLTGNKNLCGGIPQLNLPACPVFPLQKKHKRSLKRRVILFIVFGGILISCVAFIRERKITPQNIKECLVSFARIGVACSEEFPSQRMNIKDVIMELQAIKQKLLH
ncbi:hypothetical protein Ahy_A07g031960 [Arachis hypogaea]|uniref:Leucine-rich repeat-containing N-terminal plant-type domain-containing protein n=1 Tax=Arachis hypogaea TaxID=3818 RepID=A0A445C5M5_ARAHY|nr:hypothetical protein Ahy_A07g031960 [Arachis hypogaea]